MPSSAFKKRHKTIDWTAIARMRDKLVHHYFRVNLGREGALDQRMPAQDLEPLWRLFGKEFLLATRLA